MARSKGKVVDKWKLRIRKKQENPTGHPHDDYEFTADVEVPVRMIPAADSHSKICFAVHFEYGGHWFRKQSEDVNALRLECQKWLENVVTFDFEDYFYVEFGSGQEDNEDDRERADTVSAFFKFTRYQLATNPLGQKVYRDLSRTLNNGNVTNGWPEVGDDLYSHRWHESTTLKALVRATPENEKILLEIKRGYASLSEKLRAFLRPEGIEQRLAAAANRPFALLESSSDAEI